MVANNRNARHPRALRQVILLCKVEACAPVYLKRSLAVQHQLVIARMALYQTDTETSAVNVHRQVCLYSEYATLMLTHSAERDTGDSQANGDKGAAPSKRPKIDRDRWRGQSGGLANAAMRHLESEPRKGSRSRKD